MKLSSAFISLLLQQLLHVVAEDSAVSCTNKTIESSTKYPLATSNQTEFGNCPNSRSADVLLFRKKRALGLPEGSNFIITVSLLKAILIGLPLGWNVALEIDVPYKATGFKELVKYQYNRYRLHNRERRELLKGIETVITAHGLNGQACILRTICELRYFLAPKNTSFVHDILRILLTIPENGGPNDVYRKASQTLDCNEYNGATKCPLSLLDILVNHGNIVRA